MIRFFVLKIWHVLYNNMYLGTEGTSCGNLGLGKVLKITIVISLWSPLYMTYNFVGIVSYLPTYDNRCLLNVVQDASRSLY